MTTRGSFIGKTAALTTSAIALPSIVSAAPAGPPIQLKIAAFPIDPIGVAYFAKDLGYFEDAGLDVTLTSDGGGAGPQMAAAVATGAIDIAVTDPSIIASAHLHGVNFKYVAPAAIATLETRTDAILVATNSSITKAADLNGKTIGTVSIHGLQQMIGMSWVDKYGGDSKTLKFLPLGFTESVPALVQGRVDAVLLTEPFISASKAVARSLGNVLDGLANRYLILGFFANGDWLSTHGDAAARFAAVIKRAAIWANAHQAESAKILLKYSRLDPAVAATMPRSTYGTSLDASLVQPVIDGSFRYRLIDRAFPAAEIIWPGTRRA